ncbi:MAG: hypothetical protein ACLFWM_11930 [Actinomycetota bacterium]
MAERVFVEKLTKVGFAEPEILERHAFELEHAAEYPLFTPDLIELMERLLPDQVKDEVATVVTLRTVKPV